MSNDPYADLGNASKEMQDRLVEAMVARAEDPKQIEMRRDEARRRVSEQSFFGAIAFVSVIATKPG